MYQVMNRMVRHDWYVPRVMSRMERQIKMKFYYVYILKSLVKDFIYVGFTTDLKTRFKRHNSGTEFSTKPYRLIVEATDCWWIMKRGWSRILIIF